MQQSKKVRKVVALLMVLAMLFSIATPAMAALISGEQFTVKVVKVVDGNAVDSVTLTKTCLQSTGHSGYNHSTNLRDLANSSGFTGYKGYNWSKYTTVPSSYTKGLAPNNNYAAVHYNITGSAPYKADETLFLFFESTTYSYTVTHVYRTNGTVDGQTTTTVSNIAEGTTVSLNSIPKNYTYNGNVYSYTSGSPASAAINNNSVKFTLYYDRTVPTTTTKPYTVYKVFHGITDAGKIPNNFTMTYAIADNGGSGTLNYSSAEKTTESGYAALKWTVQATVPTNTATNTEVTFTESNYAVAGYDWQSFNGSNSSTTKRQIGGGALPATEYLRNYYKETPTEQNLTVEKHVAKVGDKAAAEATGNDGKIYYSIGDIIEWAISINNPNGTAKTVSLGESAAYNDSNGTGSSSIASNKLTITGGNINWNGNSTNADVTVPANASVNLTVRYQTSLDDVMDGLKANAAKLFNHVVLSGYTINGEAKSASTDSETVYLKTEPEKTETDTVPSITKSTGATDVKVGDTFAYTITVTNSDTQLPATNVQVTDSLPEGLEYVESTIDNVKATPTQNGQTLTWTIDKLDADATATIIITVKAAKAGSYTNSATVTTGKGSNDGTAPAVTVTELVPPPVTETAWDKLTVNKIADKDQVNAGEEITYTLTVANSTGKDLTNIEISEALNGNLEFVSAEPSEQYDTAGGVWKIAALTNGATATLTITAKVNADVADKTSIPNTATITAASDKSDGTNTLPEGTQPSDSADVTVNNGGQNPPPVTETAWDKLTVNKTVAVVTGSGLQFILDKPEESILQDAKVTTGSSLLYTITVSNDTGKALTAIAVQEMLADQLLFVESDSAEYDATTGVWTIASLADKAQAVLHILAVVKDDAAVGSKIENTATITAAQADSEGLPDRNRPSHTVTVTVDEAVPDNPVNPVNPKPTEPSDDDNKDDGKPGNSGGSSGGYDGAYSDIPSTPATPANPTTPVEDTKVPLTDSEAPLEEQTDRNDVDGSPSEQPGELVELAEPQAPLGDAPKTGDTASAMAYAGLLVIAAGGLVITRRKYN